MSSALSPAIGLMLMLALAGSAAGQEPATVDAEEPARVLRPYGSFEWQYSRPLRNAVGAALFLATRRQRCEDGICVAPGIEASAHLGVGGWRVAAGPAWGPLFGANVLLTATRTWSSPRGASGESTYVGVEGGYQILFVRSSVGIARRVSGPPGPKRTIPTWSVAVRVPLLGL